MTSITTQMKKKGTNPVKGGVFAIGAVLAAGMITGAMFGFDAPMHTFAQMMPSAPIIVTAPPPVVVPPPVCVVVVVVVLVVEPELPPQADARTVNAPTVAV